MHVARALGPQGARRRGERAARGHDVVDDEDGAPGEPCALACSTGPGPAVDRRPARLRRTRVASQQLRRRRVALTCDGAGEERTVVDAARRAPLRAAPAPT